MLCGVLPCRGDLSGRFRDLFDSHPPEQQEAAMCVHDAAPAQLGDPPQLSVPRAAARAQESGAAGRGVAQPDAAPAVAAEPPREPQHAARGIAPADVARSAETTGEAEQERGREPEATAPLARAQLLPGLAAREHVE